MPNIETIPQFVDAYSTPTCVSGLCGRIIRGKAPEDFLTLSDDPTRKVVMLMGPDGLENCIGLSGYDQLMKIGYPADYANDLIKDNTKFKMVVFQEGGLILQATWDNVAKVLMEVYPDIAGALSSIPALKNFKYERFETSVKFSFREVQKNGPDDDRYMTYDRFKLIPVPNYNDLRAFLYFTCYLNELFSGDGYTYDEQGNRGLQEFIIPNQPIQALVDEGKAAIIDMEVSTP